ncbi:Uncharacterised protein [Yersinia aldovae]|uniref:Uncharacterized protein n=1 Tax=Yersinia aldovae TaxID=29483 RepID=A0A0T9TMI2_YERAL|nr:Uncharacterised protein [Yersinia aldovae]CNL59677.1 Uncharacterised protein [Yersinia aldovae]
MKSRLNFAKHRRFVENDPIDGRQNRLLAGSQLPFILPLLNRSRKAPH